MPGVLTAPKGKFDTAGDNVDNLATSARKVYIISFMGFASCAHMRVRVVGIPEAIGTERQGYTNLDEWPNPNKPTKQ